MATFGVVHTNHTLLKQGLHHLKVCSRLWTNVSNCGSAVMKNKDGLTIFTRSWQMDGRNPKAIVFISHGITDHCGRHHKLAAFLQENQYSVYAHDHVGHGKSDGDRIHIDDFQTYVRDVIQHIELLKNKHPGLPTFIIGESMGGAIAALTIIQRPQLFTGAVFTAPAIISNVKFSRVQTRVDDPLVCQDGLKAKWSVALYDAQHKIQQGIKNIQIPFLTLHGTKDKVVDISSSYYLMKNAQSKDKTLKVFEGRRHLLFHETEQELARQLVLDWLNNHCS